MLSVISRLFSLSSDVSSSELWLSEEEYCTSCWQLDITSQLLSLNGNNMGGAGESRIIIWRLAGQLTTAVVVSNPSSGPTLGVSAPHTAVLYVLWCAERVICFWFAFPATAKCTRDHNDVTIAKYCARGAHMITMTSQTLLVHSALHYSVCKRLALIIIIKGGPRNRAKMKYWTN